VVNLSRFVVVQTDIGDLGDGIVESIHETELEKHKRDYIRADMEGNIIELPGVILADALAASHSPGSSSCG